MSKELKKTPTATEARNQFFDLLDKVSADSSFQPVISHRGKPVAVLANIEEWESLLETVNIAANPQLVKNLNQAKNDIKKGNILTYDEVFGHPQPGFTVADKGKVVYKLKKAVAKEKAGKKR